MNRYSRQIMLEDFGLQGQEKLLNAKVLVIGVGGLGCPVLLYLAIAGVGTLGMADHDKVAMSNLHRQILFDVNDVGQSKVLIAERTLKNKNPDIHILTYDLFVNENNVEELISGYDIVVDATDNFAARYLLSDACSLLNIPLVYGAISGYEGQAGILCYSVDGVAACYRDIYPVPPAAGEVNSCNESGVLGVLPGLIGMIQANEVIKLITKTGTSLLNKIFMIDIADYRSHEFEISPGFHSDQPRSFEEISTFDYRLFCHQCESSSKEISVDDFNKVLTDQDWTIIDVRDRHEIMDSEKLSALNIPLGMLKSALNEQILSNQLVLVCSSGVRSLKGVKIVNEFFPDKKVISLKGGLNAWNERSKD